MIWIILRKSDTACRYGGEEFLIFLPESNIKGALVLANKIHSKIEKMDINIEGLSITISIGLILGTGLVSGEDIIKKADKMLYKAKKKWKK